MAVVRIQYEVDKSQLDAADDSLEKLDKTTEETQESTEELNASTASLGDQLKTVANRFTIAGKGLGDLGAGLGKTAKGAGAATKGAKTLSFAMKAIPIIALIAGFAALVAFFTKTERGAQKLRVITATLGAAFSTLTDVVVMFGEKLFNAIDDPQQALQELKDSFISIFTEFIPNAIQKVLDGFGLLGQSIAKLFEGDFSGALEVAKEGVLSLADGFTDLNPFTAVMKKLTVAVIELGKEAVKDAEAAGLLENRLNKVLVAERALSVARAQANAQIEKEKLLAEDVTKTFEEREAAAIRAFELESDLLAKEVALQRERVAIIQQQNALSESNEDDLQAEADALIQLALLEQASGTKQIELNNKINSIRAEKQRSLEAELAVAKEVAKADAEAIDRQIAAGQALSDFRKKLAAGEEKDLRRRQQLLIEVEVDTRNQLLENEELLQDERILIIEESEEEIRRIKQQTQDEIAEGEKQAVKTTIGLISKTLGALNSFSELRVSGLERQKSEELAIEGKTEEEKEKIELKFNSLILAEQRKIAARNKLISLFDIGLNTAEAITKALPNIPLSIIIGAIGAAQAIAVASTPLPFKDGVINLQGGVRGKDSIASVLMPGESVMTTRETSDFLPTFNAIRKGYVDPDLLNSVSLGGGGRSQVVKVPGTEFYLNEKGFAAHIRSSNGRTIKRQRRYSTKMFK